MNLDDYLMNHLLLNHLYMLENLIDDLDFHLVIYEMIHYLLMNYRMD